MLFSTVLLVVYLHLILFDSEIVQLLVCIWLNFLSAGWGFRVAALEDREYQIDRLEFVKNQLNLLIDDIKKKIKAISEDVESKVM